MTVTDIIDISKKQCKIMLDYEFAFVLYKGELRLYGISVGKELPRDTYDKLIDEVLTKRCKLRAMNLLKERSYTEKKLRIKLERGQYPAVCVDRAMDYVRSFGYINDMQYAEDYLFYHGKKLNRQQIFLKLRQKGLSDEIIRDAYQKFCDNGEQTPEEELIYNQLRKKHFPGMESCTPEEKNKYFRSLLQKGYSFDAILSVMRTFSEKSDDYSMDYGI